MQSEVAQTPVIVADEAKERVNWLLSLPFIGVHIAAVVGVFLVGFSWKGVALVAALYFARMFGVTAGYHRYFSHRTYKTSRAFQLFLALLAQSTVQKGVLWWASHHRHHHKFSDTEHDVHSMSRKGFLWSHMGWILCDKYGDTDLEAIPDMAKYPELRFLNRWHLPYTVLVAAVTYWIGGAFGLVYGFFVTTVLVWHGTFTINSISHWMGKRRFPTKDDSKNSWFLAIITMGEGWHNNHHFYHASVRQGFYWWEYDVTYYLLRMLSWVGIVWDLQMPPMALVERARLKELERRAQQAAVPAAADSEPDLDAPLVRPVTQSA